MKRREVISLPWRRGGRVAARGESAAAEGADHRRAGYWQYQPGKSFWREFRQGLRDLGYIEGQNIRFEFRSAEGHLDRLPELAAELVRLKVDVIVTWFTPTAWQQNKRRAKSRSVMGRDRRSHRYRAGREPSSAGRKCHRHRERKRRTGRQERPIDPRHAAVGAPGHRSG